MELSIARIQKGFEPRLMGQSSRVLVGIEMSPWSEKARWVLDYHGVPYRYEEHTILLGMPALSGRLGIPGSEITLPVLLDDERAIFDSFAIAQKVDSEKGGGLIPASDLPEIKHYNLLTEVVLEGARVLMMDRLMKDPGAQADSLPGWIPGLMRPSLRFMARMGTRYIQKEFNTARKSPYEYGMAMMQALVGLDTALNRAGGQYLIGGRFTMADILGAIAVNGIAPPEPLAKKMRPGLLRAWTNEELASRFGNLMEWRDRIYREHRHPKK